MQQVYEVAADGNSSAKIFYETALPVTSGRYSRKDREFWLQPEIEALLTAWHEAQEDDRIRKQILRDYTHPTYVRDGHHYYPRIETITRGSPYPADATAEAFEIFRANEFAPTPVELADALRELIVAEDKDPDDSNFDPEDYLPPELDDSGTWEWIHLPEFPSYCWVLVPKEQSAVEAYAKSTDPHHLAALRERDRPRQEAADAWWREREKGGSATKPADSLEALTYCPGLVGELVDWITETARRPNRVLALGAAVTVIGTLIGRRIAGPTNSGTHLYVVGLSATGAGKDHPLVCTDLLMKAANAAHLMGPDEFISMPAVINFLVRQPLALCPQDEFGAFIHRINSKSASEYERNVSKTLRTAWGRSFTTMRTPEWAGRSSEAIYWPALSICGASTHREFFEAVKSSDLSNGFLNRFLVLSTVVRVAKRKPAPRVVSSELASRLHELHFPNGAIQSAGTPGECRIKPVALPWGVGAEVAFDDFEQAVLDRIDREPNAEQFISRSAEMAVRLATIRAVGRKGDGASVELEDLKWGIELVHLTSDRLISEAGEQMTGDASAHSQAVNRVITTIKAAKRISRSELLRKVQRHAKAKDLESIINTLIESETITKELERPPSGGAAAVFYKMN